MKNENYLVKDTSKGLISSACQILTPNQLKFLDNPIRFQILELLAKKSYYPSQIAKKLNLHEQKIYYHVKQMQKIGIIEVEETQEIRGTVAKRFRPTSLSFAVSVDKNWKKISFNQPLNKKLKHFLNPFIEDGFNSLIVVGSPDAHGPFKASARDGHYAIDLALFLGQYTTLPSNFSVKLDVDVKIEKKEDENLILIGGPGPNMLTYDINDKLPIKFDISKSETGFFCSGLVSKRTGRTITDETAGIIARIPNPKNPDKWVLLFAGYRNIGVKSAIIGLTRYFNKISPYYKEDKEFIILVKGFDMDGDGKIDDIEVIE